MALTSLGGVNFPFEPAVSEKPNIPKSARTTISGAVKVQQGITVMRQFSVSGAMTRAQYKSTWLAMLTTGNVLVFSFDSDNYNVVVMDLDPQTLVGSDNVVMYSYKLQEVSV